MILLPHILNMSEEDIRQLAKNSFECYHSFPIRKKTKGKVRWIDAPTDPLKSAQILIYKAFKKAASYSYRDKHRYIRDSVLESAEVHTGAKVLLNIDIKDMFGSCKYKLILKAVGFMLYRIGYDAFKSYDQEDLILCMHLITRYYKIPQGVPTSSVIANIIFKPIDKQLTQIAKTYKCSYSRYVDDLAFSTKDKSIDMLDVLTECSQVLTQYSFDINYTKTRITRANRNLSVTGLTVNSSKCTVSRKYRNNIRAAIHNMKISSNFENLEIIKGKIAWVAHVHQEHGKVLSKALQGV